MNHREQADEILKSMRQRMHSEPTRSSAFTAAAIVAGAEMLGLLVVTVAQGFEDVRVAIVGAARERR